MDVVNKAPLLDPLPAPGKIAGTTTIDALGITEWRLSNGARVVLKPTNFKADEVLFRAISPGGTSLAPDRDFVAALTADEVVAEGGLGRLNRIDLNKALSTVNAAVRADITDTEEGLRGGAARGGHRDDVPVDQSVVHRAAGRSDGVRRDDREPEADAGQPGDRARSRVLDGVDARR